MAETPEEKKARLAAQLAKGRETRRRNIEARAQAKAEVRGDDEHLLRQPLPAEPLPAEEPTFDPDEWAQELGDKMDRRARLLEGIDPAIAELITDAELDAIEAEERARAEAERKKRALATVRESLRQKARVENDLIAADVLLSDAEKARRNTPVTFKINIPRDGAGHRDRAGFRIDGFLYENGRTYTRPLAIAESLHSQHYRTWLEEIRFKTLDQHKRGNSAEELAGNLIPPFYVNEARA